MQTITLSVSGMTCTGCARSAAGALRKQNGVASAEVSLETGKAQIEFDPAQVSVAQLKAALEAAGYQAG